MVPFLGIKRFVILFFSIKLKQLIHVVRVAYSCGMHDHKDSLRKLQYNGRRKDIRKIILIRGWKKESDN